MTIVNTDIYTNNITVKHVKDVTDIDGTHGYYIGRQNDTYFLPESILHNPYKINSYQGRIIVIARFRRYLWLHMQDNTLIGQEINLLARQVVAGRRLQLVCWCSPQPCHGDVIKNAIIYVIKKRVDL